jgi:hypothetical protein
MVTALAVATNGVTAMELPPNEALREVYESGTVHMELKSMKLVCHLSVLPCALDTNRFRRLPGTSRSRADR